MSDLIRKMMFQNRGPIGLGNNPSPFAVPVPDIPEEPAMPNDRYMSGMDMPEGMLLMPGEKYVPGPAAIGPGQDALMKQYERTMMEESQKMAPGMRHGRGMY